MIRGTTSNSRDSLIPSHLRYRERLTSLDKEEAFDWIQNLLGVGTGHRTTIDHSLHRLWFTGIVWLLGQARMTSQETILDIDQGMLPDDSRYSANIMMHHVMFRVGQLAGISPQFEVVPLTTDHDDIFSAEVAQQFLSYITKRECWNSLRLDFAWWLVTCGQAYLLPEWDESIGPRQTKITNPFDDNREISVAGMGYDMNALESLNAVSKIPSGDIRWSVLSPFQVFTPEGARSADAMAWMGWVEEVSPDWVWDRYPREARDLEVGDFATEGNEGPLYKRIASLTKSYGILGGGGSGLDNRDLLSIYHLVIPPSGWCPKGFEIISTKTRVLEIKPHIATRCGIDIRDPAFRSVMRLPLKTARYTRIPGRWHGKGLVEDLIGPQAQYDDAAHQIIAQNSRMGAPTWLAPDDSKLSNVDGDIWTYDKNSGRPELVQPPQIGQSQMVVKAQVLSDMSTIASSPDPNSNDMPAGVRSGPAIAQLQETKEVPTTTTLIEMTSCYEQVATATTTLAWCLWDVERVIQVTGESRASRAIAFKGSQLNGNVFVSINASSMKPRSRAEAIELVSMMLQFGLLNPADPRHHEAAFDAIEFRGGDHFFRGIRLNRDKAKAEEFFFARPQVDRATGRILPWPAVDMHDDHPTHIESHVAFKAMDTYRRMDIMSRLAFDAHIMQHEQQLADALMAQQAMAQQSAGGGGSPPAERGQPSPPKQPSGDGGKKNFGAQVA